MRYPSLNLGYDQERSDRFFVWDEPNTPLTAQTGGDR
jgi:hypothetical protein